MDLMRRFIDWLKLPAAISTEVGTAFHLTAGKSVVFAGQVS